MTKTSDSFHAGSKKMYGKKILSVLLTVFMLIGCFGAGFTAFADDVIVAQGQCGDDLFWKLTQDNTFTVYPGTDPTKNKNMWGRIAWTGDAFDAWDVTSIVIENGVTTIGVEAFGSDGSGPDRAETANSSGGYYQINNAYGLKIFKNAKGNIQIPDSVTVIESQAFSNCTGFDGELHLGSQILQIKYNAFFCCSNLTGELRIPNSVNSVDSWAFAYCSGFTSLTIGDHVETIANCAFYGSTGFTGNLDIPNSVISIGSNAFMQCNGFTGLTIGDHVETIGAAAFKSCNGFTGNLNIPNSVVSIGKSAFMQCYGFTSLTINACVETIEDSTFEKCNGFTGNLNIPNSVVSIGESAFKQCSGFTSLTIGDHVETIGDSAFEQCNGFTGNLSIPNTVVSIGNYAFHNCYGFTGDLTIPNSVTTIGNNAFSQCYGFNGELVLGESIETIGNSAFFSCHELVGDLRIPNSVISIGEGAFKYCYNFNGELTLSTSLVAIPVSAFNECNKLHGDLIIPDSVRVIGKISENFRPDIIGSDDGAFYNCGFDGKLIISANSELTTIGTRAFTYCHFTEINIPNTVTEIGHNAFYNCSQITNKLSLPDNVDVYTCAFHGCAKNTDIEYFFEDYPEYVEFIEKEVVSAPTLTENGTSRYIVNCTDPVHTDATSKKICEIVKHNNQSYVSVSNVVANPSSMELTINETQQIVASVNPNDATNPSLTYTSSNPSIVTVDSNGNVTAVGAGTATITIAAADGTGTPATVTVNVSAPTILTDKEVYVIRPYYSGRIITSTNPANYSDTFNYTLSNPDLISIDSSGYFYSTSNATGNVMVTITTPDGLYSKNVDVIVFDASISYDKNSFAVGETSDISINSSGNNLIDFYRVTTSGFNSNIISIDENGRITAIGYGTTNGCVSTIITVQGTEVQFDQWYTFTITTPVSGIVVTDNEGHDLSNQTITLKLNDNSYYFNVRIVPNDASNLYLNWSYDGNIIDISTSSSNNGSFEKYIDTRRPGTTAVTVSSTDGSNISKTFTVNVIAPVEDVKIAFPMNNLKTLVIDPAVYDDAYFLGDENGNALTFSENPLDPQMAYSIDLMGDIATFVPYSGEIDSSLTAGYTLSPVFIFVDDEVFVDPNGNYYIVDGEDYIPLTSEVLEECLILTMGYYNGNVILVESHYDEPYNEGGIMPIDVTYEPFNNSVALTEYGEGTTYDQENDFGLVLPGTYDSNPLIDGKQYIAMYSIEGGGEYFFDKFIGIANIDPIPGIETYFPSIDQNEPHLTLYVAEDGGLEEFTSIVYVDGKLVFVFDDISRKLPPNFSMGIVEEIPTNLTLKVDENLDIATVIVPSDAVYSNVNVTVTDPTVASYENNTLTGLAAGTTKMIVTLTNADDTEFRKEFDVTVEAGYTKVDAVAPVAGQDGNYEYYVDSENNIFIKDDSDNMIPADADSVVWHLAGEPAIENSEKNDGTEAYSLDYVVRCQNDDDIISSTHVELERHEKVDNNVNNPGTAEYYIVSDLGFAGDVIDYIISENPGEITDEIVSEAMKMAIDSIYNPDDADPEIRDLAVDVNSSMKDYVDNYPNIKDVFSDDESMEAFLDGWKDVVTDCVHDYLADLGMPEYMIETVIDEIAASFTPDESNGVPDLYTWDETNNCYVPAELEDIVLAPVAVDKHNATPATDGHDGNKEYYTDNSGNVYEKNDDGDYVLSSMEAVTIHTPGTPVQENISHTDGNYGFDLVTYCDNDHDPAVELDRETVTLTKHDEVPATANADGNVEYFTDGDGNKYVWDETIGDNGAYVQKTDAEITTSITMTPVAAVEADPNHAGNIEYFTDNNGNKYIWSEDDGGIFVNATDVDVTVPAVVVEYNSGSPASANEDGVLPHYVGNDGNLYILENGRYIQKTASELVSHMTAVRRDNVNAPTCTSDGSYDEVTYCVNCGTTISSHHVVVKGGHTDEDEDGYCDVCNEEISWHCSKCDWFNENKDKGGVFGIVVRIVHMLVHMIESIHKLT